jgi:polyisoprenoid-binding protein YceI
MRGLRLRALIATASLGTLLAVSLSAVGFSSNAQASAWELDPTPTVIAFSVRNLSVAHVDGTFRLASGHVAVADADVSRSTIEAVIDAASVDTGEPQRDAHLRSADFLDVARYPTIAFRSTRIEQGDGVHWKVTGDLTLHGTTRPVLLDVESSTVEGTRRSAHVSTTIDRRDFGMTYAGFAVGKQVVITIDAVGMNTTADTSRPSRPGT